MYKSILWQDVKMATLDNMIDAMLCSMDALKQSQKDNKEEMACNLNQLESEVAARQDSAVQRACKKMSLEQAPEFKKKGHERQYAFIEGMKDHVDACSEPDPVQAETSRQPRGSDRQGRYGGARPW